MTAPMMTQELLALPVADRITLADRLYASVPREWQELADRAWLDEAERRSVEMDVKPGMELSHEEFLAGLKHRSHA